MKVILSNLLLAVSSVISAQPKMFDGVVVNHRQEVILAKVAVETAFDALIFKSNSDTAVCSILPAHRVNSFRYFDSVGNINRQFISLRHHGAYRFFEIVIYGPVQVLRRLKRGVSPLKANEGHDYDFFCWFGSELIELKKFKSDVFPFLVQMHGQILEDFVRQSKLRLHDAGSIFSIVKKCNELSGRQRLVATR
ncbi:MAG: hypothetical protein ING84_18425 [Cytophagales bacterium]|nr:hypothetical protein [Cytophagales bacterium]